MIYHDFNALPSRSSAHPEPAAARHRGHGGAGLLERHHIADACASLWLDGELVHLEDLVLNDAGADVRAPPPELTIARDVLRSRRRIASQPPAWALSPDGLRTLRHARAGP